MSESKDRLIEAISALEDKVENLNVKGKSGNNADLEELSLELDELTRKFNSLKEMEKSVEKNQKKKIHSSTKYSQTDDNPIIEVLDAKSAITNCMLQLLSINHYLDGNESEAVVIKKLLTHQCFDNSEDIFNIQSLSVGPVYFEVKSQGIYDEQEIQTDPSSKNNPRDKNPKKPKKSSFSWFCCLCGARNKRKKQSGNKSVENSQKSRALKITRAKG